MDQKQIDYVTAELARGVSPEELRTTLLGAGYTDVQIDALLQVVAGGGVPLAGTGEPVVIKKGMPFWTKVLLWIVAGLIVIIVLLGGMVLSSLNNAQDSAGDAFEKTTLNNLRSQAELYYLADQDYTGFCDSLAITSAGTALTELDCADSVEAYRVHSILQDSTYFCIDSTGYVKAMSTQPTGLSCE